MSRAQNGNPSDELEVLGLSPTQTDPDDKGADPSDEGADPDDKGADPSDEGADPSDEGADPDDEGADPDDEGADPDDEGATDSCPGASEAVLAQHARRPSARVRERNPYVDRVDAFSEWIVVSHDAPGLRGQWQRRFAREQPLYLELGSGYGHFLAGLAPLHPQRNFVGLEIKFKRLYKAAQKVVEQGATNVQYLRFDALQLELIFAPGELAGVYVNFPDPWPKNRHEDKRMVSRRLARTLELLLPPGGTVQLKSDWEPNREAFLEAFEGSRFELTDHVAKLDEWHREEQNIVTSYERRFRASGLPCFFYEFTLR